MTYGLIFFLCVEHDPARTLYYEQYFSAHTLRVTPARESGGRVQNNVSSKYLFLNSKIGISQYCARRWEQISSRLKKSVE